MLSPSKSHSSFGKKASAWTDWSFVSPPTLALYVVCALAGDGTSKKAESSMANKLAGNTIRFIFLPQIFEMFLFRENRTERLQMIRSIFEGTYIVRSAPPSQVENCQAQEIFCAY